MSNIPITSRVTVSLLGVFLQTRSLQVDGGSPSLWTSQQGWSDMQPLLKVHGSHFLSLAANLAFPAFPLSSWISLLVKRFLSEACQQKNSIKIRILYFRCHTSHPRSSLQYQCSATQNIWITTSLAKGHSQLQNFYLWAKDPDQLLLVLLGVPLHDVHARPEQPFKCHRVQDCKW